MRYLNLESGLGGNVNLIDDSEHEIVNIELDPKIYEVHKFRKPNQTHILGDSSEYLIKNYKSFDFIWTSPPCQTHSKMNKATRHNTIRFVDPMLHQRIIFLKHWFKGKYIVENVIPYYEPYPGYTKIGRHLFWSNFEIKAFELPEQPKGFITMASTAAKKEMMDWLGIHYEKNIYYGNNHCPVQILRNCVHPLIGKKIFDQSNGLYNSNIAQTKLF